MANFTQLHIENPQDPKKTQTTKNSLSKEKALFGAGLIAVTAVSGVFLLITNGCSKGSSTSAQRDQRAGACQPERSPTPRPGRGRRATTDRARSPPRSVSSARHLTYTFT